MNFIRTLAFAGALGASVSMAAVTLATAQELKIGLSSEPTAIDPHYHNLSPNNALVRHVFEALVGMDEKQKIIPGLAEGWRSIDDTTWEFKLRKGVKWHDGSDFTADDVLFTFGRAGNVPRSPAGFGSFLAGRKPEKINDYTIHIKTLKPDPLLLQNLASVTIVSAKAGKDAATEDYNSGKAAIGTGPYKFAEFVPGDRIVLVRNDAYWGNKPVWEKLVFKPIKSDPSRVAALLAGDVDVIEAVPTTDVERLKKDPKLVVTSGLSNRVIYFHMDQFRDTTPFITAKDGKAIKNPLRDKRVRVALSHALNRPAIVERVMEEQAVPAGQYLANGFSGVSRALKPDPLDLAAAKKLLGEAGLADGFKMTIHGPNGRYTNDTKIVEAAAQMFARVGIEASVETLPPSVFFTRASTGGPDKTPEFSFILVGWAATTGEMSESLRGLVATVNKETGMGAANRGRYSNPKMDDVLNEAMATVDDGKREALLARAMEIAAADMAVIPILFPVNSWASRKGVKVTPRTDEYTLATGISRQ